MAIRYLGWLAWRWSGDPGAVSPIIGKVRQTGLDMRRLVTFSSPLPHYWCAIRLNRMDFGASAWPQVVQGSPSPASSAPLTTITVVPACRRAYGGGIEPVELTRTLAR